MVVYADGVKPAKKIKKKLWPVMFSLVELPRTLRDSFRNKIISGVWVGREDPHSDVLYKNLINQIELLNEKSIQVKRNGDEILLNIDFYALVLDGPARSCSLGQVEHSGYYCCHYCLIRGIIVIYVFLP